MELSIAEARRSVDYVAMFGVIASAPKNQRVAIMQEIAERMMIPYATIRNKYYAYQRPANQGGGDKSLVDRRKVKRWTAENAWLPCYLYFIERDKNTSINGYRVMMEEFRSGALLPILGKTWQMVYREEFPARPMPERCPGEWDWVPRGASYKNLQAQAKKNSDYQFAIVANRKGMQAAHALTLKVLKTRVGLHVGQIYQFDDVWHNTDIMVGAKSVQPLEYAGYCVASGFKAMSCIKPRFVKADGVRDNLKEQQFRWALANLCIRTGFYKGGVQFIVEHGTTAIREKVEKQIRAIKDVGDLISFGRSGIMSEQVHAGLFVGNGGGNFRMKALCEGAHNILHNREASLLGNRGRDAAHLHESQAALVKYETRLMEIAATLPPEFAMQLEMGLLTFDEYLAAFRKIEDTLMDDAEHRLEGWDGKVVKEWRLSESDRWHSLGELEAEDKDKAWAIAKLIGGNKDLVRVRPMSRREAWMSGQSDLIKVDDWYMPFFLDFEKDAKEVLVKRDGLIGFKDELLYGRDEILYRASVRNFEGWEQALTPGRRVWAFYNPFVVDKIWIMDGADGHIMGTCPLFSRAPAYDRHAIEIAMGEQAKDLAKKVLPIRGRHQGDAEERARRMAANLRVIEAGKAAAASGPTFSAVEAADVFKLTDHGETEPAAQEVDEGEEESILSRLARTRE